MTTTATSPAPVLPPDSWFDTARAFPRDRLVTDWLAAAAAEHPQRPALITGRGVAYTHAELDLAVRRSGAFLASRGVGPGSFVGLLSEHHPEAVRALAGVLAAGGAYVPLDPRWPSDRLAQVLAQAGCRHLLVDRSLFRRGFELLDLVPGLSELHCLDAGADAWPGTEEARRVEELWDFVARHIDPLQAAGFNLGEGPQLTEAEVAAYRDRVLELLGPLPEGARVLEIGCGSGLIMRGLIRHGARYSGLDPSTVAVAACREWAEDHGSAADLRVGFAHQAGQFADGSFDRVVLTSVAQFFPGPDYLDGVIELCLGLLAPEGRLVLADLVDPRSGANDDLLRVPRRYLSGRFRGVQIEDRDEARLAQPLATRYDAVLGKAALGVDGQDVRLWSAAQADRAEPLPSGHRAAAPQDLAYAIFTSGSTGAPKGVMIQHRAVANLVDWVNREFQVTPDDQVLFVTSFAFDLSVYDMFGVLGAGGAVRVVPDRELADPEALLRILDSEPITFWDSAPATMALVLASAGEKGRAVTAHGVPALRRVFLSGDWIPVSMPDQIRQRFPGAEIIALGGATEATVWSNCFRVGEVSPEWPSIPYGRPMQNARYHVLDERLAPCPVGVPGDLYIAGECLAAGYLRASRLTADRFLPDPRAVSAGERMYDTGDRARWREDGNLEFLGRRDDQVKIQGYRIELGDVQAAMSRHPRVASCAAVVAEVGGERRLIGYYTCREGVLPAEEFRRHLTEVIPSYMVPMRLQQLRQLPVTANGKLNRTELVRMATQSMHVHGPGCGRFCTGA